MAVEARASVDGISLAITPSGGVTEINVVRKHLDIQEAALDLSERAGRFNALSSVALITGFCDIALGLAGVAAHFNSPMPSAISAGIAFGVSVISGVHLENKGNHLREQIDTLLHAPERLTKISEPASTIIFEN